MELEFLAFVHKVAADEASDEIPDSMVNLWLRQPTCHVRLIHD